MGVALPIRPDLSADDLRAMAGKEKAGRVVARMLAIAHVLDGKGRAEAAQLTGLDRQSFRDTVVRYNAEGLPCLYNLKSRGRSEWLSFEEKTKLTEIIIERPNLERDGCVEWTLPELCVSVIAGCFGKTLHPASLSRIVRRLKLSRQKTRPRHPKSDEEAQKAFKDEGLKTILMETTALYPGRRIQIWFQDEARVGQKGRVAHRWWWRGKRPLGLCDRRFSSTYIYAAVCPATGDNFALVMPEVNTKSMNRFLEDFSKTLETDVLVLMVMDQASWHGSKDLIVSNNIIPVPLPPYSPELNPVERVWLYLREHFLSHRVLDDYDAIVDACCVAWNALAADTERMHSLTSYPWIPCVIH